MFKVIEREGKNDIRAWSIWSKGLFTSLRFKLIVRSKLGEDLVIEKISEVISIDREIFSREVIF